MSRKKKPTTAEVRAVVRDVQASSVVRCSADCVACGGERVADYADETEDAAALTFGRMLAAAGWRYRDVRAFDCLGLLCPVCAVDPQYAARPRRRA